MEASETKSLPENAYRQLGPGEAYRPVVPPSANLPEATPRSCVSLIKPISPVRSRLSTSSSRRDTNMESRL